MPRSPARMGGSGGLIQKRREEMLTFLVNCTKRKGPLPRGTASKVLAARVFLHATADDPMDVLLRMLKGDQAKLEQWLRDALANIERQKAGE